jgi:large subunit ribosomal protein L1
MKKISKRIKNLQTLIKNEKYSSKDGIVLVKKLAQAKFVESIEAHISLNIDPKYANQQLRTSLILPHGTGKTLKIAVFTENENIKEALNLGADYAGAEDLLEKIAQGNIDFDVLITSPSLMPKLTKLGKILGPKGLMPSPKSGTVSTDLKNSINDFKKGKVEYRADKTGIVHLNFGKANFTEQQLKENLQTLYQSIEKNRPSGIKGKYFKSFYICTTMSPSIQLELNSLASL